MVIDTWGPEETRAFGKKMGQEARPGQVICLNGDLGVGKTIFTQGFAEGLGIDGYEDCFYGDGVSLIEWSQLIEEILPEHVTEITIEKDLEKGFDYRKIRVEEK